MGLFSCCTTKILPKTISTSKICFSPTRPKTDSDVVYHTGIHVYPCLPQDKKPGFIYLIREREFIKTNEEIYKIGKTINIKHRMPSYPKDSRLYICFFCPTCIDEVEKFVISLFDVKFKKRIDIGSEYYEGDAGKMISFLTPLMVQPHPRYKDGLK